MRNTKEEITLEWWNDSWKAFLEAKANLQKIIRKSGSEHKKVLKILKRILHRLNNPDIRTIIEKSGEEIQALPEESNAVIKLENILVLIEEKMPERFNKRMTAAVRKFHEAWDENWESGPSGLPKIRRAYIYWFQQYFLTMSDVVKSLDEFKDTPSWESIKDIVNKLNSMRSTLNMEANRLSAAQNFPLR